MKRLIFCVLVTFSISVIIAPTPAESQTFSQISNFPALPILPPVQCPPTGGWTSALGGVSPCETLQQNVDSYNFYATVANQLRAYAIQFSTYAGSLPQTLPGNLNQIQQLITTVENGNAATRTLQNPAVVGTPAATVYTQQQNALNQNMEESISAELQQMNLLTTQEAAETNSVNQVKLAAANAQSPTQVAQMNVQLLSTLYDTAIRKETLDRQNARIQAQYMLNQIARSNATSASNQQTVKTLTVIADPTLPTPPNN